MKVSELEGAELDYWVAKAEGLEGIELGRDGKFHGSIYQADEDGNDDWYIYSPSTDWSQGGPIIERVGIDTVVQMESAGGIVAEEQRVWGACRDGLAEYWGSTPLIAAMRCYVSSRFGEEVDDRQADHV